MHRRIDQALKHGAALKQRETLRVPAHRIALAGPKVFSFFAGALAVRRGVPSRRSYNLAGWYILSETLPPVSCPIFTLAPASRTLKSLHAIYEGAPNCIS